MGSARAGGQRREWRSARGRGPAAPGGRLAANGRPPPAHAPAARGERGRGERGREGPSGAAQNPRIPQIPLLPPSPLRRGTARASLGPAGAAMAAPRTGQAGPSAPGPAAQLQPWGSPSGIAGTRAAKGARWVYFTAENTRALSTSYLGSVRGCDPGAEWWEKELEEFSTRGSGQERRTGSRASLPSRS